MEIFSNLFSFSAPTDFIIFLILLCSIVCSVGSYFVLDGFKLTNNYEHTTSIVLSLVMGTILGFIIAVAILYIFL